MRSLLTRFGIAPVCFDHCGCRKALGGTGRHRDPGNYSALGQSVWCAFCCLQLARSPQAELQMAHGRGCHHDPLQEALVVAGHRRERRRSRYPRAKAAKRFFKRLVAQFGEPRVVITDKLRSYIKPVNASAPQADHRAHKGLNNAIQVSHRITRKREKLFGRFKSHRQAQRVLSEHEQINLIFPPAPLSIHRNLIPPRSQRCVQPLGRLHRRNGSVTLPFSNASQSAGNNLAIPS